LVPERCVRLYLEKPVQSVREEYPAGALCPHLGGFGKAVQ